MIEIFAPYLLIVMSWNDLDPSATMQTSQALYIDEKTCIVAGEERLGLIEEDRVERLGKLQVDQIRTENSKFFCVRHQTEIQKHQPLIAEN